MAKNAICRPPLPRRRRPPGLVRSRPLARRSNLPSLRGAKHYATKKVGVYRCATRLPQGFHRHDRLTHGAEPCHADTVGRAFHLCASSKKGFSAHQFHRQLGCQYNTAWFFHHRVMEAMRRGALDLPPMGGEGKVVEADETYYGNVPEAKRPTTKTSGRPFQKDARGPKNKRAIIALVERGGEVRSFHVPSAHLETVVSIVRANVDRE